MSDMNYENQNQEQNQNTPETVEKKSGKKLVIGCVALLVVAALVIGGAFVLPKLGIFGGGEATEENAEPEVKLADDVVASVDGMEVTDLDVNYQIYSQAALYAQENSIAYEDLATYDWSQKVGDKTAGEILIERAVNAAVNEAAVIKLGEKNGVTIGEEETSSIKKYMEGATSAYGEDGFTLRARAWAIPSAEQYEKMYLNVMASQKVMDDSKENISAYYDGDESALAPYTTSEIVAAKHILLKQEEGAADRLAEAEEILKKAKEGEDFDALVEEYNEDPGAGTTGYVFGRGEMVEEFENATYALKVGEISDVVKTSYGYHIIKRVPGIFDIASYMTETGGLKVVLNQKAIDKLDVAAVLQDVQKATDELNAMEEAAAESAEEAGTENENPTEE